jgi:hypothetical protein
MRYEDLTFEEKIALKIKYVLTLPATTETKVILDNLKWVLEIYREEKKKVRGR